jgi:hypothetical protein
MKNNYALMSRYFLAVLVFSISWACQPKSEQESDEEVFDIPQNSDVNLDSLEEINLKIVQDLIQNTLREEFKQAISLGLIDSISRVYKYDLIDLDNDGSKEIMVGLTGPYFCGSGGCTIFLLSGSGAVITKFSVVRYPVYVEANSTNGWSNLVMYSGGEYRLNVFDGKGYASNPSTLSKFSGEINNLHRLLDWEILEAFRF